MITHNYQPGSHYALARHTLVADTSHIERKMFDVAYAGLSAVQKLDIYWPAEGNGPFPVITAIHGGAFMGGDKRDCQLTPMLAALQRNYAVVSVNYRLSGEAQFPALVHDIKAAIRWVRANAKTYLFNSAKIAVWGGSAGGYLSLMAGVSAHVSQLEDLNLGNPGESCRVQAVVDWFAPTNFLTMDEQLTQSGLAPPAEFAHSGANSPESLLLGKQITLVPELVRTASPATYIHADAPPCFIQHGMQDDTIPYQQSVDFAAKFGAEVGADKVSLELLPQAGHGGPEFETADNLQKVLDFLDRTLGV
jgi:acetyl esterase/lipase